MLDAGHILRGDLAEARTESLFARSGELVGHGFARLAVELNQGFPWVHAANLGGERNDQ